MLSIAIIYRYVGMTNLDQLYSSLRDDCICVINRLLLILLIGQINIYRFSSIPHLYVVQGLPSNSDLDCSDFS